MRHQQAASKIDQIGVAFEHVAAGPLVIVVGLDTFIFEH